MSKTLGNKFCKVQQWYKRPTLRKPERGTYRHRTATRHEVLCYPKQHKNVNDEKKFDTDKTMKSVGDEMPSHGLGNFKRQKKLKLKKEKTKRGSVEDDSEEDIVGG